MIKSRYWAIIAWQESINKDFINIIERTNQIAVISPLHDKDIDENGNLQKPHWHIVIKYYGPATLNTAQEFANSIGAGTYVEKVRNVKNILDYLTHNSYSSKDKYKYSIDDIKFINCDINAFVRYDYLEIVRYIEENKIISFSILCKKLANESEYGLLEYVSKNSYYVNTFISSLKNEIKDNVNNDIQFLYNLICNIDKDYSITLNKESYDRILKLCAEFDIKPEGYGVEPSANNILY